MNNRESNRKGGRGGREEKEGGRELLFDRKSTNRQRQGREKGAESKEQNAHTDMYRNTYTGDKKEAGSGKAQGSRLCSNVKIQTPQSCKNQTSQDF